MTSPGSPLLLRLLCLIVNEDYNPVDYALVLEISMDACVSELRELVKNKVSPSLNRIASNRLAIWRLKEPLLDKPPPNEDMDVEMEESLESVVAAKFAAEPTSLATQLDGSAWTLSNCFQDEDCFIAHIQSMCGISAPVQ